jgi:hypothetical protein
MRCDEFEQILQQRADREPVEYDHAALEQHAVICDCCRELLHGFRLLSQSFALSPLPPAPEGFAERICVAAQQSPHRVRLRRLAWLAAACFVAAVAVWTIRRAVVLDEPMITIAERAPVQQSRAADLPFPELTGSGAGDSREPVALVDAVEPVSELLRAFGRSLGSPVRPIAISTSEAVGNLLKGLPDPDSYSVPIPVMRDVMVPGPTKKMGGMNPSS